MLSSNTTSYGFARAEKEIGRTTGSPMVPTLTNNGGNVTSSHRKSNGSATVKLTIGLVGVGNKWRPSKLPKTRRRQSTTTFQ